MPSVLVLAGVVVVRQFDELAMVRQASLTMDTRARFSEAVSVCHICHLA